jgi:hypothetical protein
MNRISFKINTLLYVFYITSAFCGCRCKDDREAVPSLPTPLDCFTYWPVDSLNTQWIFTVSKIDSGNKTYLYDDTMQFLKDTCITNKDDIYFREFVFKKLSKEENLIMGMIPYYPSRLYLYIEGVLYTIYDLNNISDNPPFKSYKTDGRPIDIRYEMKYYSPFDPYNTKLGIVKSIRSFCTFRDWSMAGAITKTVTIMSGEKKGPVYIEYDYIRTKFQFLKDSTANIIYEIKKINHQ